jgi:hypothetical protein
MRTSADGASDQQAMVQTMRVCLDAASEARMSVFAAQASTGNCSDSNARQPDGSWRFRSVCSMGSGGTVTSEGAATGDFNSRYQVRATTTTTGAAVPQMNRSSSVVVDSAWQGPCPEGWTGGDVELPGGLRLNILNGPGGR